MAGATKDDLEEMRREFEKKMAEAKERNKLNIQLSRKMKYQDPASKRGIGLLIENFFNLLDFCQSAEPLLEEGQDKKAKIK